MSNPTITLRELINAPLPKGTSSLKLTSKFAPTTKTLSEAFGNLSRADQLIINIDEDTESLDVICVACEPEHRFSVQTIGTSMPEPVVEWTLEELVEVLDVTLKSGPIVDDVDDERIGAPSDYDG